MSHYKIKLEDKAAFLNRLEKQDIHIGSYDITDNKYEGYFEIDIEDEDANDIIKSMLNKSPKINTIKEMRQQITKTQLKQIIREELGKMKGQKEPVNEVLISAAIIAAVAGILKFVAANATVIQILSSMGLIIGAAGTAAVKSEISRMTKEDPNFANLSGKEQFKKAMQSIQGSADRVGGGGVNQSGPTDSMGVKL
jgi:predicted DNA binding protein